MATQTVTVTATAWTLSFWGTGSVALSGVASGALAGTGTANRVSLTFTPSAGSLVLTVSGSVTNAQLESGAWVSSYIPTTIGAVTRSAENVTMPLSPWWIGFGGTFAANIWAQVAPGFGVNLGVFCVHDGTNNNRSLLRVVNAPAMGVSYIANAIAGGGVNSAKTLSLGAETRSAALMQPNNVQLAYSDANLISLQAPAAIGPTTLQLGAAATGSAYLNGYLRRIRYWPRAMLTAELQARAR
jgi:hypothetical protein